MQITRTVAAGSLMLMASLAPRADAQSIAQRIASVRDGKIRMTFAGRPDLCGWGNGISTNSDFNRGSTRSWSDDRNEDVVFDDECSRGPGRLVVTMRDGQIDRIRASIGGRWRPDNSARDFGQVSTREIVNYLFDVASSGSGRGAREAIFPATIADSVNVIQPLYDLARNESKNKEVRDQAVFWLSQQPEDRAVDLLENILNTARSQDIRDKAIFGLSQHRSGNGFPILRAYA